MKAISPEHARVLGFTGKLTLREAVSEMTRLRGDTVGQSDGKYPRVILSQCTPLSEKKKGTP